MSAVTPILESGNVYIPASAPWRDEFLLECSLFPLGSHDDQCDAMAQALTRFEWVSKVGIQSITHAIV